MVRIRSVVTRQAADIQVSVPLWACCNAVDVSIGATDVVPSHAISGAWGFLKVLRRFQAVPHGTRSPPASALLQYCSQTVVVGRALVDEVWICGERKRCAVECDVGGFPGACLEAVFHRGRRLGRLRDCDRDLPATSGPLAPTSVDVPRLRLAVALGADVRRLACGQCGR